MRTIGGTILLVFAFFAAIAATTRILTMKEAPGYVTNMFNALSNLFSGAFAK